MDYNYVRMRNAEAAGDSALAENYRRLYESGPESPTVPSTLNYVIALLAAIALALGVYIAFVSRPVKPVAIDDTATQADTAATAGATAAAENAAVATQATAATQEAAAATAEVPAAEE